MASGDNCRVCGVYPPESGVKVYCFRLNLIYRNWSILYLHKSHNTPFLPANICIGIALDFSCDIFMSGEIANNDYAKSFFFWGGGGGQRGVLWDLCK